jgi:hypothetical protein
MTAYNVVRFRTKSGKESAFIEAHKKALFSPKGFRKGALVQTGEHTFCFIGEWDEMTNIVAGRAAMIHLLDSFRDLLEDLGGSLGVTDPVSGTAVVELKR